MQAPVMGAGSDDDDDDVAGLAKQQRDLQQQVGQAQVALTRAKAELEQADLRQQQ
jgi:multidrug efflux pump subunit AcrA (membrane-fusion protein)